MGERGDFAIGIGICYFETAHEKDETVVERMVGIFWRLEEVLVVEGL